MLTSDNRGVKEKRYPTPRYVDSHQEQEKEYWDSFQYPILKRQLHVAKTIDFNPVGAHEFAITSGALVEIFDPNTNEVEKTFNKFQKTAYGARFRSDGKLLIVGGDEAIVRVFEFNSRTVLRELRGHHGPVHVCRFSVDKFTLMSASDDKTVKCWDLTTGQSTLTLEGHKDYIRTGIINTTTPSIWCTGSYDHKINLWDIRSSKAIATFDHGSPVEDLVIFPTGNAIASAGGMDVTVWDLLKGQPMTTLRNHKKDVTSIVLDFQRSRLISGSLDQNLKIYDTSKGYEVVHQLYYPAPIVSIGISPNNSHLIVGMADNMLSIKHTNFHGRYKKQTETMDMDMIEEKRKKIANSKSKHVARPPRGLRDFEKRLNSFNYQKSLDDALRQAEEEKAPNLVISLMEELIYRESIYIALANRNAKNLLPVLQFILANLSNPGFGPILFKVLDIILNIYSEILGLSKEIDNVFQQINKLIAIELSKEREIQELAGVVELLLHQNELIS